MVVSLVKVSDRVKGDQEEVEVNPVVYLEFLRQHVSFHFAVIRLWKFFLSIIECYLRQHKWLCLQQSGNKIRSSPPRTCVGIFLDFVKDLHNMLPSRLPHLGGVQDDEP